MLLATWLRILCSVEPKAFDLVISAALIYLPPHLAQGCWKEPQNQLVQPLFFTKWQREP